jgi:hypothetical protein
MSIAIENRGLLGPAIDGEGLTLTLPDPDRERARQQTVSGELRQAMLS